MKRFLTLFSMLCVAFVSMPTGANAQPLPTLTVNGTEGDITLYTSEYVSVETSEGALIRLFSGANCLTPTAAAPKKSYYYIQVAAVTQSFQAHWESDPTFVSPCRTVTWIEPDTTGPPPLTIDGVADHASAIIDHTFSIDTHPDATLDVYHDSTDCSGIPAVSIVGGTNSHSTEVRSHAYQARWTSGEGSLSPCLVASWVAPPRKDPPPLTLNGGTEHVTLIGMEPFAFVTDNLANLDIYQALDCSGTPSFTQSAEFSIVARPYNHYSAQAFWPENPDLRSACLTVEILHPVPPLSVNGSATNLSLEPGAAATFLTDPLAEISLYESADCTGTAASITTETVSETLTTDGVVSARSNWIGATEPVSECLVVSWADSTTPPSTVPADPTPTTTPLPTATETAEPTTPLPTEPASTSTSVPPSNEANVPGTTQSDGLVTSLPSTGAGPSSNLLTTTIAVSIMLLMMAVAAIRQRRA